MGFLLVMILSLIEVGQAGPRRALRQIKRGYTTSIFYNRFISLYLSLFPRDKPLRPPTNFGKINVELLTRLPKASIIARSSH
jgi:hypothetical protein